MKIEMGESLILSWLKHIKECQIVQTNWKVSPCWEINNIEEINQILSTINDYYTINYNYDLFKKNSGLLQIIAQAEIDALGICISDHKVFAVDIAFHENGLNYGSKEETISRVIKKCVRTALCIYGYFHNKHAEIIFASPKIHNAVYYELEKILPKIQKLFEDSGLDYKLRLICNDDFAQTILEPILSIMSEIADTSELFMRSLQLYNLFAKQEKKLQSKNLIHKKIINHSINSKSIEPITFTEVEALKEMKVGAIAKNILRKVLTDNLVPEEEINKMQTSEYSKAIFHIQYPLLVLAEKSNFQKPIRYYSNQLTIHGKNYFLCREWFETPNNNDRPYLMTWLATYYNK